MENGQNAGFKWRMAIFAEPGRKPALRAQEMTCEPGIWPVGFIAFWRHP